MEISGHSQIQLSLHSYGIIIRTCAVKMDGAGARIWLTGRGRPLNVLRGRGGEIVREGREVAAFLG